MNGRRLVFTGCLLLTTLFLVALSGLGTEEPGLSALVRWTARVSFALFLPVYAASSLQRLWPGAASHWLLRNRSLEEIASQVSWVTRAALVGGMIWE